MPMGRGETRKRTPVIIMRKGYSEFKYRQDPKDPDRWEEQGPMSHGWSRIRVTNPKAEVDRAIAKLESQGYTREDK